MKRSFTLLLSLFLTIGTMWAQALEFTFTKVSESEATVTVTGNEVEAGGITATVASNYAWKGLSANSEAFPTASILCPNKNTSEMKAGSEGTITLTLNNVPEGYSFKSVTFTSVALNGGGAFQSDNANAQPVNFTLSKGETVLGTAENVAIKVNSADGETVAVPFEVAEAYTAENGTLELKLTLAVTESKGCFYGLVKVAVETEVVEYADEATINAFFAEVIGIGELSYDLDATWAALPAVLAKLDVVTPIVEQVEAGNSVPKADVEAATATVAEAKAVAVYYNETYLPTAKEAADLLAALEEGSEEYVAVNEAITSTSDLSTVTTVAELEAKVAVLDAAVEANTPEGGVVKTNYTDAIVNAAVASTDGWNAVDASYGDGLVKYGSGKTVDFNQTITLPAGQYKVTAQAAYRYGSGSVNEAEQVEYAAILDGTTDTHLATLYAETSSYKYEADVQNRWEGRSETDYFNNLAKVSTITVEGEGTYYVPNSSAAVKCWFDNGKYVNELVFNVQEEGEVKIGIVKTENPGPGDYTNIGAWTLTRLGDAEADPEEEEPGDEPGDEPVDVTAQYLTNADFAAEEGWTKNLSDSFYELKTGLIGSYALRTDVGTIATVDETHLNTEYCLGLEFRWGGFAAYQQETAVELPEGVYTLSFDVENTNANTVADNYENLFYVQVGDDKYVDSSVEWKSGGATSWTTHAITFVVESASKVKVSLGIGAGATSRPHPETPVVYVSHLKLTYDAAELKLEPGDVTAQFLVNADFEQASATTGNAINTPPGWTLEHETSGWLDGSTRLSSNPGNDGSQCYNLWAATFTSADMYQKVNLPAGEYTLSAGFYADAAGERCVYATVGGQTYKSSSSDVLGTWNTVSVTFVNPSAGEVTLGAICRNAWFQIDNVRLEYLREVGKDDFVNAYNTVLAEAQALANEKMSVAAAALLETTVTANGALTADNSIEELEAATAAISEALATVKVSVNSYKVLAAGTLPDNSLDGWTCTNTNTFHINTWSTEGNSDGTGMVTPFIENWVANGSILGSGTISYTLAGVDPGYYKASSLIRVYSEAGNDIKGASFFANDVKTDFSTGKSFTYDNKKGIYDTYTAVVNVGEDGVLTFGVEIADTATFNWVTFKNVKIEYIGVIDQAAAEALKAKIPTTPYDAALAAEIAPLVEAVDAGVTFENYLALSEKVALAEASAAAYATNKLAIDAMYALMENTNVYTAEAFLAYKNIADEYKAQYEAGTLTATVDNPAIAHGWHATTDYGEMLLSAFGIAVDDWANLHINTWSVEGDTDGSEFKVPFYEYWTGDDQSLGTTTKTATVTGLTPDQYYGVEAWVRVRAKNGVAAADATGITLSVGEGTAVDITEGEVVGASQFSHAVFTAYGYADAEGKLTINFNVLDGNNVSWLSFKNLKYAEAVEPFTDFYTNPSGEEALDKLGNIELFFGVATEEVVVNEEVQATLTTPVIVDDEYFVASVWTSCYDNEDNPENVFKYISFELEETYTEPGEYVLTIPEGLFTVDGAPVAATKLYFTVKEPAPVVEFDATIESVTPAAGEVTELSTIIVQFSNDLVMPQSNIFLTDEAGDKYEFQLDTNHPDFTQAKYVAINGAITTAGTYTLDCSQIDHATSLWPLELIYPFEGTFTWTVAEAAETYADFFVIPFEGDELVEFISAELLIFDLVENVELSGEVHATLITPTNVDGEVLVASHYLDESIPEEPCHVITFEGTQVYTAPGAYTLTIPEGLFTVDGAPNAATVVNFTVKEPAVVEFEAKIVSVTPAEGEVTELSEIIVQFDSDIVVPYSNVFVTNEAGDQFEFELDPNHGDVTQARYFAKDGAITAAGTYTLDCSQIDHVVNRLSRERIYPFTGTYTWTIKAGENGINNINADADAVIYDIHGRRVTEMTKGLYIVNGKKVVIK